MAPAAAEPKLSGRSLSHVTVIAPFTPRGSVTQARVHEHRRVGGGPPSAPHRPAYRAFRAFGPIFDEALA